MATVENNKQKLCISCNETLDLKVDYLCDDCGIAEHVRCIIINNNVHGWLESNATDIENDRCFKCAEKKKTKRCNK